MEVYSSFIYKYTKPLTICSLFKSRHKKRMLYNINIYVFSLNLFAYFCSQMGIVFYLSTKEIN